LAGCVEFAQLSLDAAYRRPQLFVHLGKGLAEEHRWVPDSGWITFHMRSEDDVAHALWLMQLSYLR